VTEENLALTAHRGRVRVRVLQVANLTKLLNAKSLKDSEYKVFILSTRAGGLGLNPQTADTVIR
jgi:SNF2 family DNA or RNA helicase